MDDELAKQLTEKLHTHDYVVNLIELVKGHPCLWDKSCTSDKYAENRFRAWRSICSSLIGSFDEDMCLEEKAAVVYLIKQKWKKCRYSYLKSLQEGTRKEFRSGHLFAEQLNFLLSDSVKTYKGVGVKNSSKLDAMQEKSEDSEVRYDTELQKKSTFGEVRKGDLIKEIADRLGEKNKVIVANKEEKKELDLSEKENISDERDSKFEDFSSILSKRVNVVLERCDAKMSASDESMDSKLLGQENVKSKNNMDDKIYTAGRNETLKKRDKRTVLDTDMKSSGNEDLVPSTTLPELDGHGKIVSNYADKKSPEKMHFKDVLAHSEAVKGNGEKKPDEQKSPEAIHSKDDDFGLSSEGVKKCDERVITAVLKKSHEMHGEKNSSKQKAKKSIKIKSDKGGIATVCKQSFGIYGERKAGKQKAHKSNKLVAVDGGRSINEKNKHAIEKHSVSEDLREKKLPEKTHSPDVESQCETVRGNSERKLNEKKTPKVMRSTDDEFSPVKIKKSDKEIAVRKKSQAIYGEKKVIKQKASKTKKLCEVDDRRRVFKKHEYSTGKRSYISSFISQSNKKCKLEAIDAVVKEVNHVVNRSKKHASKDSTWGEKAKQGYPIPQYKLEIDDNEIYSNLKHRRSMEKEFSPLKIRVPSDNRSTDHSCTHLCNNHLMENLAPSHEVDGKDCAIFPSQNRYLDEDEQFFISIMSSVKTLSQLDKIYFRMNTIQLLRDIRKRHTRFGMEHDLSESNFTRIAL